MTVTAAWTSPLSATLDLTNGFVVQEANWDAAMSNHHYMGGADGNTKTGPYSIGGMLTLRSAGAPDGSLSVDGAGNMVIQTDAAFAFFPNNEHNYWLTADQFYPSTDLGASLGAGSNRWSGLNAHDGTFTGNVGVTGTVSSGAVSSGSVSTGSVSNTGAIALGQTGQVTNIAGSNIVLNAGAGNVIPSTNNDFDLGGGAVRWSTIFLQNAPDVVSSRAMKQLLDLLDPREAMAGLRDLPIWHYRSLRSDGEPDTRFFHTGPVAEDLPEKMQVAPGRVTGQDYAGWLMAAVQDIDRRLAALEGR